MKPDKILKKSDAEYEAENVIYEFSYDIRTGISKLLGKRVENNFQEAEIIEPKQLPNEPTSNIQPPCTASK